MAINITLIAQVTSALVGLVGGTLGVLSWSRTRKIQLYQLEEMEVKKRNKLDEDKVFEDIVKEAGHHALTRFWSPEIGSAQYKIMERLVDRGKLYRTEFGAFMVASKTRTED